MEIGKLNAQYRTDFGKGAARKLRQMGLIPGVCYGNNIDKPHPITLSPKALKESLDPEKRHNTVIDLDIEGLENKTTIKVMLKDYQIDPIRRDVLHVDLIAIDENKLVEVEVPIELTGKAKGIVEGGQLHMVRHTFHIRCKPADIPAKIQVDVTEMDIGSVLHISDVTFPEGVIASDSAKLTLVTCTAAGPDEEEATKDDETEADPAAVSTTDEPKKS